MIERHPHDAGRMKVTFRVASGNGARRANIVGDFNDWSPDTDEMEPDDRGFIKELLLEPGRAYRFRYLFDGERWENDWAADAYEPNDFGGDDSVLDLRNVSPDELDPPGGAATGS